MSRNEISNWEFRSCFKADGDDSCSTCHMEIDACVGMGLTFKVSELQPSKHKFK